MQQSAPASIDLAVVTEETYSLPSIMLQQLFYYSRCKGLHFTCLSPMPHSIPPAVTHLHFQLIVLDLLHCQGHYLKNPTVKGKVGLEGWQHKRKNTS